MHIAHSDDECHRVAPDDDSASHGVPATRTPGGMRSRRALPVRHNAIGRHAAANPSSSSLDGGGMISSSSPNHLAQHRRRVLAPGGGSTRRPLKSNCPANTAQAKQALEDASNQGWDMAENFEPTLTETKAGAEDLLQNTIITTDKDWDQKLISNAKSPGSGPNGEHAPNELLDTVVYVRPESVEAFDNGDTASPVLMLRGSRPPAGIPGLDPAEWSEVNVKAIQVMFLGELADAGSEPDSFTFRPENRLNAAGEGSTGTGSSTDGFNMIPASHTTVVPLGEAVKDALVVTESLTGCSMVWAYDSAKEELHTAHITPNLGTKAEPGRQIDSQAFANHLQESALYFEGLPGVKAHVFGDNVSLGLRGYGVTATPGKEVRGNGLFMVVKTRDGNAMVVRKGEVREMDLSTFQESVADRFTDVQDVAQFGNKGAGSPLAGGRAPSPANRRCCTGTNCVVC